MTPESKGKTKQKKFSLQNVVSKDWSLKGTIDLLRTTDDERVVSYDIITDKGHRTTRHRRYLRPLHKDHDPKMEKD